MKNFHLSLPFQEYIHRVGRTARAGGRGHALLMLLPEELTFLKYLKQAKVRGQCNWNMFNRNVRNLAPHFFFSAISFQPLVFPPISLQTLVFSIILFQTFIFFPIFLSKRSYFCLLSLQSFPYLSELSYLTPHPLNMFVILQHVSTFALQNVCCI